MLAKHPYSLSSDNKPLHIDKYEPGAFAKTLLQVIHEIYLH